MFDRIGLIRTIFAAKSGAAAAGVRWVRAARHDPDLMADVIRMGGILAAQADQYDRGVPLGVPIDPVRLAYEAGKRDLALQLTALMGLTPLELQSLMEDINDVS